MNLIYKHGSSPQKYDGNTDKTFTIGELKKIVEGPCDIMFLPIQDAYIIYNSNKTSTQQGFYNHHATEILRENYKDTKVRIHGTALLTDNI